MHEDGSALSAAALDHFEHPRNSGELSGESVYSGAAGSREQGAQVLFTARVGAGRIEEIRFRAYGCPHTIAAASWITERLSGASVEQLQSLSWREIEAAVQVPLEKRGRLLILEDALRAIARHAGRK